MKRDEVVKLSARLAVMEFYLEVLFSQAYSLRTEEAQNTALNSIHRLVSKDATLRTEGSEFDVEFLGDIHSEMVKYSRLISDGIAARANSIRQERKKSKSM